MFVTVAAPVEVTFHFRYLPTAEKVCNTPLVTFSKVYEPDYVEQTPNCHAKVPEPIAVNVADTMLRLLQ